MYYYQSCAKQEEYNNWCGTTAVLLEIYAARERATEGEIRV
jgi:hypothetical protein